MIDLDRIKHLPTRPGCYLFKDAEGTILYVGKAASLRQRVRSYFNGQQSAKIQAMLAHTQDVDFIVTDSEIEALILESNLIKEHQPKYNVRLRDDKQFPYICVTVQEPFPRVFRVRRTRKDGARYFGPYADSGSLNETLSLLKKLFPYRSCDLAIPDETMHPEPVLERPCLEYFIKRCTAPCVRYTTRAEYTEVIQQVLLFLEGRHEEVLTTLKRRMQEAAAALNFEAAAHLRDQIAAVERVIERQKITTTDAVDQDVIGMAANGAEACVQVFQVRSGKVVGRDHFLLAGVEDGSDEEMLSSFLKQFYDRATHVPRQILLPRAIEDATVIEEWLAGMRGGRVSLLVPQRGEKRKLVQMVTENAQEVLEQNTLRWMSDSQRTARALKELQEALDLPTLPWRIECFDISTIQGTFTVASMVVFENGRPKNADYRRFKIKSVEGIDDFASMAEVIKRRFQHIRDDGDEKGWVQRPDLVIVDGGKGQLNAALDALHALNIDDLNVISLAKQQEEIFVPGRSMPILLPRTSQALYLVQRIRDEAHRFAITYHRQLRGKRATGSALDAVPGIGPARRKALIKAFGSVHGVKAASIEELIAVPGITAETAAAIKQHLA
jgi:excinuclease ABC subunit C